MRLPILSSRDLIKVLHKIGFIEVRQKGSHKFFRHPDGRCTVVPIHTGRDIGRGLLRQILREIEDTPEDLLRLKA